MPIAVPDGAQPTPQPQIGPPEPAAAGGVSGPFRRPAVIGGAVAYAAVLVWLSVVAAGPGTLGADLRIERWVQRGHGSVPDGIATVGYWFGLTLVDLVVAAAVIVALVLRSRVREIMLIVMALLLRALNAPLKLLFDSPRPGAAQVAHHEHAHGLGFPSGHVMGVTLVGGALLIVLFRRTPSPGWRWLGVVVWLLVLAITSYSRIERGAHWPSDVLGALLWGGVVLAVAVLIAGWIAAGLSGRIGGIDHPPPPGAD